MLCNAECSGYLGFEEGRGCWRELMRWECDGGAWYWGEEGRDGWCSNEGEEARALCQNMEQCIPLLSR